MESTIIIALITACTAIVAPVITEVIKNKNNLKMKEIEAKQYWLTNISLHEREVLENALAGMGILIGWQDKESIKESCKSILKAVAYVDNDVGILLIDAVNSVMDADRNIEIWEYEGICDAMRKEIAKRIDK